MLGWAFLFFLVAVVAAYFGYGDVATGAGFIAQILFFIFLVLFAVSVLVHVFRGRQPMGLLGLALALFIVALLAAWLGFGWVASEAAWIAQLLFVVFVVLFVISLIVALIRRAAGRRT